MMKGFNLNQSQASSNQNNSIPLSELQHVLNKEVPKLNITGEACKKIPLELLSSMNETPPILSKELIMYGTVDEFRSSLETLVDLI